MEASDLDRAAVAPSAPSKESVERHLNSSMETSNTTFENGHPKQVIVPTQVYLPPREDDRPDGTNRVPRLAMRLGRGICYLYLALAGIVFLLFIILVIVSVVWLTRSNASVTTDIRGPSKLRTDIHKELENERKRFFKGSPFDE